MNINQFKHELRLNDYKADRWGSSYIAFFEVCEHLYFIGVKIPDEWGFKPSPLFTVPEKDSYYYSLFSGCNKDELFCIGQYLHRLTNLLIRAEFYY